MGERGKKNNLEQKNVFRLKKNSEIQMYDQ